MALAGILLAVIVGCVLRLWNFLGNPSLWSDEASLALNIVGVPWYQQITGPLGYHQVAPPGFLLAETATTRILGANEFSLRTVPLVCGLLACALFGRVAWRVLSERAAVLACLAFAVAPALVRYSSEVKQYSSDVLLTLVMTLVALNHADWPKRRPQAVLAALAGAVLVWGSHALVLAVAGLGGMIVALRWYGSAPLRPFVSVVATWAVSAACVVLLAKTLWITPETSAYMQDFWSAAFFPVPPTNFWESSWILRTFTAVFGADGCGFLVPSVAFGLAGWGALSLVRRDPLTAALLAAPLGIALGASALRLYPFGGRTSLFLFPALLLFYAEGVDSIARRFSDRWVGRAIVGLAFLYSLASWMQSPSVHYIQELRPVLNRLQAQLRSGDAVYVYYGAIVGVKYYGDQFGLTGRYDTGRCHRGNPRAYFRELDRYRGRTRVWVVISASSVWFAEDREILAYLGTIGQPLAAIREHGASAHLFDLSHPEKLLASAPDRQPLVSAPRPPDPTACDHFSAGPISPVH